MPTFPVDEPASTATDDAADAAGGPALIVLGAEDGWVCTDGVCEL